MGSPEYDIQYVSSTDFDHQALGELAGAENGQEAQIGWIPGVKKVEPKNAQGVLFEAKIHENNFAAPSAGFSICRDGVEANTDAVLMAVFPTGMYDNVIGKIHDMTGIAGRSFTPIAPIV